MGEFKHIKISSLNLWIVAFHFWNTKKFCEGIKFLITQNKLKVKKCEVGTREESRAILKKESKLSSSFNVFSNVVLFVTLKITLQFARLMTKKLFNLVKE